MSILVKNVQFLGAANGVPERGDIFINDDKIIAVGNLSGKKADETIDGQGVYCSPGFIDVHNDSDHYWSIFDNPGQEDAVRQGITTVVGGNAGSSLAPLIYGSLEAIRKWTDIDRINVDWHSLADFLGSLEKKKIGVNFGTLTGHSTIRRALIGESRRQLTRNELDVFARVLKTALSEGALGCSAGLSHIHARGTSYAELKFLADIVGEVNGVFGMQIRKTGPEIEAGAEEAIKLARETNVKLLMNGFMPVQGFEAGYEKALEKINNLPPELNFRFDVHPAAVSILPLYSFLPSWAQNGNLEVMTDNLRDEWLKPRILQDFPKLDPKRFVVAQSFYNSALVGSSLSDLMNLYGFSTPAEALYRLMLATGLRAIVFYENLSEDLIKKAIQSPRSFIGTNAPVLKEEKFQKSLKSEQSRSTFIKFLAWAENGNLLPLHDAVHKITREPAREFGLEKRGEIAEGNFADLVGFKNGEIKFTIINGRIAMKDGVCAGSLSGQILRRHV